MNLWNPLLLLGKCSLARGNFLVVLNNQSYCDWDLWLKTEPSALKISCLYFGHGITTGNELSDTFRSDYHFMYHSPALHTANSWNNEGLTVKAVRNLAGNRTHYSTTQCCILIQLKLKITNFINRTTWNKPSDDTRGYSWIPVSLSICA